MHTICKQESESESESRRKKEKVIRMNMKIGV